jgi:hypothetical protein
LGVSVFAFDFAGSGMSDGEYVSLGWYEREVRGWAAKDQDLGTATKEQQRQKSAATKERSDE